MNKNQPAIVVLTVLIFFIEGNITAGAVVRFFAVGAQNKLLMVDNLVKVLKKRVISTHGSKLWCIDRLELNKFSFT